MSALWQAYAAMRPEDGRPPIAIDRVARRSSQAEMDCLRFLLKKVEEIGKVVEEERHWAMLQARQRNRLPDQSLRMEYRLSPEPKTPPSPPPPSPPPLPRIYCEVCGGPADYLTNKHWSCLNHLNEYLMKAEGYVMKVEG